MVPLLAAAVAAQTPAPDTPAERRVDERIRALQRESQELARESQTLVGELRKLEIDRDMRVQEAVLAETTAASAQRVLDEATARLEALEAQRTAQLPDLRRHLVDLYKQRNSGYAPLLAGATGLRDFARAMRAVASLAAITERRIVEHRKTLQALTAERATLEQTAAELKSREGTAREARIAAERAVASRAALLARIDTERDLAAQYVGELNAVQARLEQQIASSGAGRPRDPVAVPLAPFRGGLDWPAEGKVAGRFGQATSRLGGTAVRNGVEIAAPEDAVVRAVHGGTVGYADVFTGLGNLVILDHGGNDYSLYGYLGSIQVERGASVETGAELGRVGLAPAGPPALYFELRIDGRSVDPLQWLKKVP
jgi:septal ring factor EnvC (AmiA/AmiB activator)